MEDEGFDIERHVGEAEATGPLPEVVARLFEQRLDRSRPLWRIDVVALGRGRLGAGVADPPRAGRRADLHAAGRAGAVGLRLPSRGPRAAAGDDERRRAHLAGFVRREFGRGARPLALRRLDRRAAPGRLRGGAAARAARRGQGPGRRHPQRRRAGGDRAARCAAGPKPTTDSSASLRARVPVSLHRQDEDAGNRDSYFCVALPLSRARPGGPAAGGPRGGGRSARPSTTPRRWTSCCASWPACRRAWSACASASRPARGSFALSVSNVRGPAAAGQRPGRAGDALHFVAEIGERHALRVSVNSFADELSFGLCADPDDRRRPRRDGRRRRGRGSVADRGGRR